MSDKNLEFSISNLFFMLFIFILAQFILFNLFNLINNFISLPLKNPSLIFALLSTPLILVMMLFWAKNYQDIELSSTITNWNTTSYKVIALFLSTCGLNIILSEVNNISHHFFPLSKEIITTLNQIIFTDSSSLILIFLVSTTINIILKEILIRGLILKGMLNKYRPELAILAIAVFQLLINFSLYNLLTTLTISILLSWLYIQTRSILDCILASLFFNLLPYLSIYFSPFKIQGFNTKFSTAVQFQPVWFNLLGIILLTSGSWLFFKHLNSEENKLLR